MAQRSRPAGSLGKKKIIRKMTEIGWCELVDITSLGLTQVHAKMDSGAATSSIHATRIKPFDEEGAPWVEFSFHASAKDHVIRLRAPVVDRRMVRSSNGKEQLRYVIAAQLKLGSLIWDGQLTLANRGSMAFPVLIGRRGLKRGFLVNSGKKWMLGKPE
ncbi:ATP-dependent zinc protease [Sphingorhabdus arenilitoris]|uniref:ATP-dependent zinc protease n=1 Tax=Sphingorhabdus arenilitoris TaxID=1490041 RepID=A0ABV8RCC9_9SPHN